MCVCGWIFPWLPCHTPVHTNFIMYLQPIPTNKIPSLYLMFLFPKTYSHLPAFRKYSEPEGYYYVDSRIFRNTEYCTDVLRKYVEYMYNVPDFEILKVKNFPFSLFLCTLVFCVSELEFRIWNMYRSKIQRKKSLFDAVFGVYSDCEEVGVRVGRRAV